MTETELTGAQRAPLDAGAPTEAPVTSRPGARRLRHWSHSWVTVVVAVGVLVTAGLTIVSARLASTNEQHLLNLRGKEVGSALTSALPDIETPLGAAVALADITGADAAKFGRFATPYVGAGRQFVSMSVWRVAALNAGPVDVVGASPELPQARGGALPILRAAGHRSGLTVRGLLHATSPRIAYAYVGAPAGPFIVEAEAALTPSRYTRLPPNSAYSNVNVAVYISRHPNQGRLLLTTVRHLPLPGRRAMSIVPFGSATLTVVVSERQALAGTLPRILPWAIAVIGVLLTIGAALLTFRLIGGSERSQALALENQRLYAEQHGIAQRLQHALLPEELPQIDGVRLAAIYEAGVPGIDIGGDWYDLIRLDEERLLLVVGDVSGRGLRAATAMASLRFAIEYAAQTEPPEVFLPRLSGVKSLRDSGQLATALFVVIDVSARTVSVTSAGHLPLLMVCGGRGEFLHPEVGLPIGVATDATYRSTTFDVPPEATLLGFTDGLVERRDESLDEGLDRLCRVAANANGGLPEMIAGILQGVRGPESVDDTAIAGIQWSS